VDSLVPNKILELLADKLGAVISPEEGCLPRFGCKAKLAVQYEMFGPESTIGISLVEMDGKTSA
jgi:hypothetical protein